MLCARPVAIREGNLVGCGSCPNCLINRRRVWTARILLEGIDAEKRGLAVSWSTLTYSNDNLPLASRGGAEWVETLRYRDCQLLVKRLRKRFDDSYLRYCIVGEYGGRRGRPHWHMLLFGPETHLVERGLQEDWESSFGHTRTRPWRMNEANHVQEYATKQPVHVNRARYLANYTTKNMTNPDSAGLQPEQEPELFRTSREPPIGCVEHLVNLQTSRAGSIQLVEDGDVMAVVRLDGELWPLGSTVRKWLRDRLDVPQTRAERVAAGIPQKPLKVHSGVDYERAKAYAEKAERKRKAKAEAEDH